MSQFLGTTPLDKTLSVLLLVILCLLAIGTARQATSGLFGIANAIPIGSGQSSRMDNGVNDHLRLDSRRPIEKRFMIFQGPEDLSLEEVHGVDVSINNENRRANRGARYDDENDTDDDNDDDDDSDDGGDNDDNNKDDKRRTDTKARPEWQQSGAAEVRLGADLSPASQAATVGANGTTSAGVGGGGAGGKKPGEGTGPRLFKLGLLIG